MALIKLTGVPHPDLHVGRPMPVYLDATRVLFISASRHQRIRMMAADLKREAYDDMWTGVQRLTKLLNEKMPTEIDNQEAAKWAKDLHLLSHSVQDSYSAWGRSFRAEDYYPPIDCTEVQLACGTALENGVMLSRVWVSEPPEKVAELIGWRPGTGMG